jgi:hypothetical protein
MARSGVWIDGFEIRIAFSRQDLAVLGVYGKRLPLEAGREKVVEGPHADRKLFLGGPDDGDTPGIESPFQVFPHAW